MLNLTMLDGVNRVMESVAYGTSTGAPITELMMQSMVNLGTQFVPSIVGAVARTIDPTRRKTYTDKNSALPSFLRYPFESVQNKLPGTSQLNTPYLNAWGEEDTEESVATRILENFIFPGYVNKKKDDPVVDELLSLSVTAGEDFIPELPSKYFSVNGVRHDLIDKQYETLTKTRGQTAHALYEGLFASDAYQGLEDTYKRKAVNDVMDYATEKGKREIVPEKDWSSAWMGGDDPLAEILKRAEENQVSDYRDLCKISIAKAYDTTDLKTAYDWVYALRSSYGEGKDDSVRSKVSGVFKEKYLAADDEERTEIRNFLLALGIGYKESTILRWGTLGE